MPSSATGVGMPICLLGGVLLILTQKNSQKFGDVFTNHIHKLHNALMCLFFDAYLFTISCSKVGFGHKLVYIPTLFSAWDDTVTFTVD